jgi:hypothetical protein
MHRFVWDLHYPAAQGMSRGERPAEGVWAPPGHYTVELDAGGANLRQKLVVKSDPRAKVADAALQREFVLAVKVETAGAQAGTAVADATKLLKALDARLAAEKSLHAPMAALMAKITAVSGVDLHPRNPMMEPHRTDSLRMLAADLAKLENAVDGADAEPSKDATTSYTNLH